MLKVFLIDDHALIRKGLMKILLEEFTIADIDEASSAEDSSNGFAGTKICFIQFVREPA